MLVIPQELSKTADVAVLSRKSKLTFFFLLPQINHPLDCPICDQGGECDLQDQVGMSDYPAKATSCSDSQGVLNV